MEQQQQQIGKLHQLVQSVVDESNKSNGRTPTPQNSLGAIEKALIPVIHKIRSEGTTTDSYPGKSLLVSISQHLSQLYVQQAMYGRVTCRIRKLLEKLACSLPETKHHIEAASLDLITTQCNSVLDYTALKSEQCNVVRMSLITMSAHIDVPKAHSILRWSQSNFWLALKDAWTTLLHYVSNLLEGNSIVQHVLQEHFNVFATALARTLAVAVDLISSACTQATSVATSNQPAMQLCHIGAKLCLQFCQFMGDTVKAMLWNQRPSSETHSSSSEAGDVAPDDVERDFHQILQALLDMISSKKFSKECSLMAGGALTMLLNLATDRDQAVCIVRDMLNLHNNCDVWTVQSALSVPDNCILRIGNASLICKCPSGEASIRQFSQLSLLRGLLTCVKMDVLVQDKNSCEEYAVSLFIVDLVNYLCAVTSEDIPVIKTRIMNCECCEQTLLVDVMFPLVCNLCHELKDMQYHSLQVLIYWLQTAKNALPILHESQQLSTPQTPDASTTTSSTSTSSTRNRIFHPASSVVDEVLSIAWQSWQSPVDGVAELIKSLVALLLQCYDKENKLLGITDSKLFQMITARLQKSLWHVKCRYPLLCTVIPYCNTSDLLASYPALPSHLLECMETNHLAAVAADVYQACLEGLQADSSGSSRKVKRRKSEEKYVISPSEQIGKSEWEVYWKDMVLNGLYSEKELTRYSMSNHWLSLTIQYVPTSYGIITNVLQHQQDSAAAAVSKSSLLHAQILLLQQARMHQITSPAWVEENYETIHAAFYHADAGIRKDALNLVCISPKKAQLPSDLELRLLQEVLPQNLNCDSASFRNNLNKCMKCVLLRVRDGALGCLRQLKKDETREDREGVAMMTERLNAAVGFLSSLLEMCVSSLFPGACYQRKKVALDLISLLYDVLLHGVRKRQAVVKTVSAEPLIEWAKNHHQFDLLSARTAALILACIQDGSNDIRLQSFHLLISYFPANLPSSPAYPANSNNEILCSGLKLISYPKTHMADAGALLCKLIFNKNVLTAKDSNPEDQDSFHGSVEASHQSQLPKGIQVFVTKLLDILKYQFERAQQNFVSAAALTPMHGVILTIRRCVTDDDTVLKLGATHAPAAWSAIIQDLLSTIRNIVSFVLGILSGRKTEEEEAASRNLAPSFGQMGEAIDGLIGALARVQLSEKETGQKMTALSDEHQIVLACCWLNLKESSLLLGALVESSPLCDGEGEGGLLRMSDLQAMADIMLEILTKCRHKGAIESCHLGFSRFCARLLSSQHSQLVNLPHSLLDRVCIMITNEGAESSFTRRSAGLPYVVESIVVSEPKGRERHLLQYTMQKLTAIASQPLPDNPSDILDLPQSHAINIMRVLFRCAAISSDMLEYVADSVEYAIKGFASPCWTIRNCCMQLFGTLISRVFGQKRVADEHSTLNSLSASEFLFRYPTLKEFLLAEMRQIKSATNHKAIDSINDKQCILNGNNKGGVFMLPTMHPVLTLISKLGLGVEQDSIKRTLTEFLEPIMVLLSSPIYSIRVLASRAILPLIPEGKAADKAIEIISALPRKPDNVQSTNQLHGHLLLVHALIRTSIEDKSLSKELCETTLKALGLVSWLASDSNRCAVVRALFIDICNKTMSWLQTWSTEDLNHLVGWMKDEAQSYFSNNPKYQVGLPILNKVMVFALLNLSLSSDIHSHIACCMQLITSPSPDTRQAVLEYMMKYSTQDIVNEFCRESSWHMLCRIVNHEPNVMCIEAGLDLWVYMTLEASGAASMVGRDDCSEVWERLGAMADGQKGTTLCALALPVLSIILKDHLEDRNPDTRSLLSEWSNWMLQYCDPAQTETVRMSVSKSLQICGLAALKASCLSNVEENIPAALCVFSAGLRLLQDEQSDIRALTASFAAQLPRDEGCIKYPSVHSNQGIQFLVAYICKYCVWSFGCYTALTRLLQGPDTPSKLIWQQGGTRPVNLFEQESSNIYAEGVMEAKVIYSNLLVMSRDIHKVDPVGLNNWLHHKCNKAVRSLQDTLTALDQALIMESNYYKATGQSNVFQVVYRQLLYVQLLQQIADFTLTPEDKLWKDINKLRVMQRTLYQTVDIHPILKDALPAIVKIDMHDTV